MDAKYKGFTVTNSSAQGTLICAFTTTEHLSCNLMEIVIAYTFHASHTEKKDTLISWGWSLQREQSTRMGETVVNKENG